jgi:hypothetical protein
MPLARYGVLVGKLFTPQERTYQGDWFHGIFYLTTPASASPLRNGFFERDERSHSVSNILESGPCSAVQYPGAA